MMVIPRDKHVYSFGPNMKEVARAKPGEIVIFQTLDALGGQVKSEEDTIEKIDFSRVNPATGPLYVEGAKRGGILRVDILDIKVEGKGAVVTAPGAGVLGKKVERPQTRICEVKDGFVIFKGIKIPAMPMIGVIGVAYDEEVPTGTPGKHGGNMDTNLIRKGTTIYFPVFVDGAYLAIGDLHAVMGDGEVCVSACEVSGEVTVRVTPMEGKLEWPLLETEDSFYLLVSDENLDKAIEEAVSLGVEALRKSNDLSWDEAYMLASLVMDVEISQLVDPRKTVRVRIPKGYVRLESFLT
ncbi:acetamidase/formamidase family protein [Pyrococcus abyssi]|nr:acetamidase/formamidase family protein [Pyrococcus abyssi]CCE70324.1 TPA: Acetamidase/Formamidase [Pyrococcus abyssi GE5]